MGEGVIDQLNFDETKPKGSSLKICMVAEGQADVYCRFGPTWEWDTAAADAVLRMAGGNITEPDGNSQVYNSETLKNDRGFLVTNSLLHEDVSEANSERRDEFARRLSDWRTACEAVREHAGNRDDEAIDDRTRRQLRELGYAE